MPLGLCASSSRMGHSHSLGDCDLAVVAAPDTALADAAATAACNAVRAAADITPALDTIMGISGVAGVLIVKNDKVGMAGDLPELVPHQDPAWENKVSRDRRSRDFFVSMED